MRVYEPNLWIPVGIILFYIALFFVLIAPAMLATPEQVEELEKVGDDC